MVILSIAIYIIQRYSAPSSTNTEFVHGFQTEKPMLKCLCNRKWFDYIEGRLHQWGGGGLQDFIVQSHVILNHRKFDETQTISYHETIMQFAKLYGMQ